MIWGKHSRDAGTTPGPVGVKTLWMAWAVLLFAKGLLAWQLPLMADEAFYAWESRRLAWAYSDLPGLTAWLIALGTSALGDSPFAIRWPFLLIGSALPWLMFAISARWFGPAAGAVAAWLGLAMPLSGLLGVLALPDVPLVLASLACLDAIARLRERVTWPALAWLALALVVGATAHYRFAWVLLAGGAGVLADERSRRLLVDGRVLLALAVGIAAWWPLLQWNLAHDFAGLRFQAVDRHPWRWSAEGWHWPWRQALLVTPGLFLVLVLAQWRALRAAAHDACGPWRLLMPMAALASWGWFVVGFFVDRERVSFHWPLAGWVVSAILLAPTWPSLWRGWHRLAWSGAVVGLGLALAYLAVAATPTLRLASAGRFWYPQSFAGGSEVAALVAGEVLPAGTVLVADHAALAARLAWQGPGHEVRVLDHPLNHKHGRAAQIQAWGAALEDRRALRGRPALLLVEDSAIPPRGRLHAYRRLCRRMGGLPPVRTLDVDHGSRRYFVFAFEADVPPRPCVLPALGWVDRPGHGARVRGTRLSVSGWAFKEGAGVERVELLVDGRVRGEAQRGHPMPHVATYWGDARDPDLPRIGLRLEVHARGLGPGRHWLAWRVHGRDGSVEDLPAQPFHHSP